MANRFPLWGQAGWASAEVVGETHYATAIRALFGSDFDPRGTDITLPVDLIPDRNNRHDRNAVGVWANGSLLGHLPRPEAARYVSVLTALTSRGLIPEVNARITGREWGAADGRPPAFDSTIRLDLAEPHLLVPANSPPAQVHRLLPAGSAVQVVGQQQALQALQALLRPGGGECWAYVTLHETAGHLVEVRVGDVRVGDLSPKMSAELLPVLRHLAEQGSVTAARALVKGNGGESEVMLYVARVQDLPQGWQPGPARQSSAPSAGRGTAAVPAPGVASSGPVMPGANPPPAVSSPVSPAPASSGASAVPGMSMPGGLMTGGPAASGLVPNWVSAADSLPSWASPPSTVPAPAPLPPPALPVTPVSPAVPSAWNPGAPVSPRVAPVSPAVPFFSPGGADTSYVGSRSRPPATAPIRQTDGSGHDREQQEIAETTVIPALAAVVKANSGVLAGVTGLSSATAGGNQHAPIPPAPTGIKFVVPPGWPVPPDGWYPPEGWQPDPAWPLAPAGWQWWVPAWD